MITKIVNIQKGDHFDSAIAEAAGIIRQGGLVAFPTETVYGLGANALDETAVQSIFEAKGRPQDNPLIVHTASAEAAFSLTQTPPDYAVKLAERFWPGPLTLVLKKGPAIPEGVTAGLDSVAVRIPGHKAALALIQACGVPIAAPSANASGRPSPTRANHVAKDLGGRIPLILDGGPCRVGLESTVLDCTGEHPVILRPGAITPDMIRESAGSVTLHEAALAEMQGAAPSPGMKHKHYSPQAKLFLVEGKHTPRKINALYDKCVARGMIAAILGTKENAHVYGDRLFVSVGSRRDMAECARNFFGALHALDEMNVDEIYTESFSPTGIGLALMNRMLRAASFQTIDAHGENNP
jgi:L-threonylcarbamoyladenylate synthase